MREKDRDSVIELLMDLTGAKGTVELSMDIIKSMLIDELEKEVVQVQI